MAHAKATRRIGVGAATLSVEVCGSGETVMLIPSWARAAEDFSDLMDVLASAGYRAVGVNLRGIGGSTGALGGITLHDLAGDVAGVLEALDAAPAHIVGHAFGNRVARCLAADRPELVKTVALLGPSGQVLPQPEVFAALKRTLAGPLPDADWLAAMRTAGFFAPTSDPMVWRHGWWPAVAEWHGAAALATAPEDYLAAGHAPLLVIQGLDDKVAVPANGRALRDALGGRVRLIEIRDAGHAMLPEQPGAIAEAIVTFLRAHGRRAGGGGACDAAEDRA
jgi:pimeloyl-ACP methyl ester carboxylesterase